MDSVHYEMPKSTHIHKSMLIRGVKFLPPKLNHEDIESTRERAAKTGRSHGGVGLKGNGRGRDSMNFGAGSNQYNAPPSYQQPYRPQNGYSNNGYAQPPPPGWFPPPPGLGGFGRGLPPPPPPGYMPPVYGYDNRSRGGSGSYGDQYRGRR